MFTLCNTSLSSSRVYLACAQYNLSVVRVLNVIPVEGKPPLFTVFVITLNSWLEVCPENFPVLQPSLPFLPADPDKAIRIPSSLRGEDVSTLMVRLKNGSHSAEYQQVLSDLGKPSSADREIYDHSSLETKKDNT